MKYNTKLIDFDKKLRSEDEIITELEALLNQIGELDDDSLGTFRILEQRVYSILWVLNYPKSKSLVMPKKVIELFEGLG